MQLKKEPTDTSQSTQPRQRQIAVRRFKQHPDQCGPNALWLAEASTADDTLKHMAKFAEAKGLEVRAVRLTRAGHVREFTSGCRADEGADHHQVEGCTPDGRTRLLVEIAGGHAGRHGAEAEGQLREVARQAARWIEITECLVGDSPPMLALKKHVLGVADCRSTVLITGETGTGKELVARAIHDLSARAGAEFVAVNCGALTESLLEAELFGSVKGAFTGATSPKRGLFVAADKGTIFLDEFGEMSPAMQVKLLRVLQERRVRPVGAHGGREEIEVDVRIIAATNKDLEGEVRAGRFREDLYFRINVQPVHVPPLRERATDIPALVRYLLIKVQHDAGLTTPAGIEAAAVRLLRRHAWLGNVRELASTLECVSAMAGSNGVISVKQVSEILSTPSITIKNNGDIEYRVLWPADEDIDQHFQRQLLELYEHVREMMNGSHTRTAHRFGVNRTTLHMRVEGAKQRLTNFY